MIQCRDCTTASLEREMLLISSSISSWASWARRFTSDKQVVLLIDEIDKADLEFPERPALGAGQDGILHQRNKRNDQDEAQDL